MFVLSKLLSAVTQPVFWLALWWGAALLLPARRRRLARAMLWTGLAVLGLLGFQAIPDALLRPLESRYPIPPQASLARHQGVVVLGGGMGHPDLFLAHGQVPLEGSAERLIVSLQLLRRHPDWRLVYSGGEGRLLVAGVSEADMARRFYAEQGVDMRRVQLEGGSRNTRENALQAAHLMGEACRAPWLLVTSAWHMPRAMAEFEAVGCNVTAYPVDFMTGRSTPLTRYSLAGSLLLWQTALHEWVGILVYGATRERAARAHPFAAAPVRAAAVKTPPRG